jgi:membrane peptidoglycan carboxypeptidase
VSLHAARARRLKRLSLGVVAAVLAAMLAIAALWIATPPVGDVSDRVATQVRLQHGALLPRDRVPPLLANALAAAEDERFYQHHGLDIIGIGRAALDDIKSRCLCEGGSTITQQLVKLVYLDGSDRGFNKVEGMLLAVKVEMVLDKQSIMAAYLSDVPMGPNINGAEPSSCHYFRKPLEQLDLAQYALLAGMPQAPSAYDPLTHPAAALRRRHEVLALMVFNGYISSKQEAAADQAPLPTAAGSIARSCSAFASQ